MSHQGVHDDVAEVQRALLWKELSALPQGLDGRNHGHHLNITCVVSPDREKVLVDGLCDPEVFLYVVLPLVGGPTEDEVRENPEEELLALLLGEGVVHLGLLHHDGLADQVRDRHALPVLFYAAADVALLAYGPTLLEAVQEGHACDLRAHSLGVHARLVGANDPQARDVMQDANHLLVAEEGVQHALKVVFMHRLLHPEGGHHHIVAEAPLVEQRLHLLVAERGELGLWQEVEPEVILLLLFRLNLLDDERHSAPVCVSGHASCRGIELST
mmetsp:Transcript_25224/g.64102  ORF Transcript_25224/g.64102 Transcript_25224/m.64102 type:complete len:272 (+) Transcript_25224:511-1326(+)